MGNSLLRRLVPALTLALAALFLPANALAETHSDPLGFKFLSPVFYAHEADGQAVITVVRTNVASTATVSYITLGPHHPCGPTDCTAEYGYDFKQFQGVLTFPVGVAAQTFTVPIVDHHASTIPDTIGLALFGGGLAEPHSGTLAVLNDDPLSSTATSIGGVPWGSVGNVVSTGNPLAGLHLYVDHDTLDNILWPLVANRPVLRSNRGLAQVADQPWVERFGRFSTKDPGVYVSRYLARSQVAEPGSVPEMNTYRLVPQASGFGRCGHWADTPEAIRSYHDWISRYAEGIGSYHAILYLEMDALITSGSPCLSAAGSRIREAELADAVNVLSSKCPNLVIYMDAGAADGPFSAAAVARRLVASNIAKIQGFFLNSTHYDWTSKEIAFGEQVSRLTGGKHFVVNTTLSGQGPQIPADRVKQGNEVLCNPTGRGIGPLPTTNTGYPNVDAFAWILHPGESTNTNSPNGKPCGRGAPANGQIWYSYLLDQVKREDLRVR